MTATYDVTTDAGRVRLLITDTNTDTPVFEDAEIDAFLGMYHSNVHRAAAEALDTIATSQVLTLKVIKILDLQTQGDLLGAELRARATQMRELADTYDDGAAFDWAEMVNDQFSWRERVFDQWLRGTA